MYLDYFGLKEPPFSIAPNPRYLFMSERHREALAHLVYGLQGAGGFVVLTGEVGAGKTTLARRFLEEIPAKCRVAYLINPNVTVAELLQTICDEFDITVPNAGRRDDEVPSNKTLVDAINGFLLSEYAQGRNCVVIVDEAQNLPPEVMEQLRLLTNLETDERKLLQIILIGQPELRELLARHDLRQVDQRVVARYHLDSLDAKDTEHYLAHRLSIAGGRPELFQPAAAAAVHAWTDGVPRRINVLADRALLGTYAKGLPQVSAEIIERAASEVFQGKVLNNRSATTAASNTLGSRKPWGWLVAAVLAAALAYFSFQQGVWSFASLSGKKAETADAKDASQTGKNTNTPDTSINSASIRQDSLKNTTASNSTTLAGSKLNAEALITTASSDEKLRLAPAKVLLQLWRLTPPSVALKEPLATSVCEVAVQNRLACMSAPAGKAGYETLRNNNHPVLVTLATADQVSVMALIDKLDERTATVQIGNTRLTLSAAELLQFWQGDYLLLWTPLYQGGQLAPVSNLPIGTQGAAVSDMLSRLGMAGSLPAALSVAANTSNAKYDANVQVAVKAFQTQQGLIADGGAGPQTLVRLNAAALRDEPRLQALAAPVSANTKASP